jgi:hypothetical protein
LVTQCEAIERARAWAGRNQAGLRDRFTRRNVLGAINAGRWLIRPSNIETEYEQFPRGIIRLLRGPDRHPGSSAKVQDFGAKLLAMQRAAL